MSQGHCCLGTRRFGEPLARQVRDAESGWVEASRRVRPAMMASLSQHGLCAASANASWQQDNTIYSPSCALHCLHSLSKTAFCRGEGVGQLCVRAADCAVSARFKKRVGKVVDATIKSRRLPMRCVRPTASL